MASTDQNELYTVLFGKLSFLKFASRLWDMFKISKKKLHNHNIQLKWTLIDIYEPIFMLMGLKIWFCVHISVSWANSYAKLVKLHFASLIKKHVIMHNMVH